MGLGMCLRGEGLQMSLQRGGAAQPASVGL